MGMQGAPGASQARPSQLAGRGRALRRHDRAGGVEQLQQGRQEVGVRAGDDAPDAARGQQPVDPLGLGLGGLGEALAQAARRPVSTSSCSPVSGSSSVTSRRPAARPRAGRVRRSATTSCRAVSLPSAPPQPSATRKSETSTTTEGRRIAERGEVERGGQVGPAAHRRGAASRAAGPAAGTGGARPTAGGSTSSGRSAKRSAPTRLPCRPTQLRRSRRPAPGRGCAWCGGPSPSRSTG